MKKTFCDCCGDEMTGCESVFRTNDKRPENTIPDLGSNIPVKVELRVFTTVSGEFDICERCKWRAVDRIDPRPTVQTPPRKLRLIPPTRSEVTEAADGAGFNSPVLVSNLCNFVTLLLKNARYEE
jgi:hypothetical protein